MIYQVKDGLRAIEWKDFQEAGLTIVVSSPKELVQWKARLILDERNIEECACVRLSKLEAHHDYLFGTVSIPVKRAVLTEKDAVAFFLFSNVLLFVDASERTGATLERLADQRKWKNPGAAQILCDFLEDRIGPDQIYLEELETQVTVLEEAVLGGEFHDFSHKMLPLRKQLLYLHSFYEQMVDMGEDLEENESFFRTKNHIERIKLFTSRMQRLSSHAQTMREYSMQVWEVYQSQVDIRQNKIMRLLTVVTTLFMPLTLITGWYGMNFAGMPELRWNYGYPMIIAVSVLVILVCLRIFKKKKMF